MKYTIMILVLLALIACASCATNVVFRPNPETRAKADALEGDAGAYFNSLLKGNGAGVAGHLSATLKGKLVADIRELANDDPDMAEIELMIIGLEPVDLKLPDDKLLEKYLDYQLTDYRDALVEGCCDKKGDACCRLILTFSVKSMSAKGKTASVTGLTSNGSRVTLELVIEQDKWKVTDSLEFETLLAPLPVKASPSMPAGCPG